MNSVLISRSNRFIGFRINTIVGKDFIVIPKSEKGKTGGDDFSLEDEYLLDDMRSVENEEILLQTRADKWNLAIESFKKYTPTQKIFGTGFKYLTVYSGKTRTSNHPHCQIFAIMLFSGILGLTLYLTLFTITIYLYFKYFKSLLIFFFLFFANLSMGFFSFSDFFGASFYIFLLIIPSIYHLLNKKNVLLSIQK